MTAEKPEWWKKENPDRDDVARSSGDPHLVRELLAVIDRQTDEKAEMIVALIQAREQIFDLRSKLAAAEERERKAFEAGWRAYRGTTATTRLNEALSDYFAGCLDFASQAAEKG